MLSVLGVMRDTKPKETHPLQEEIKTRLNFLSFLWNNLGISRLATLGVGDQTPDRAFLKPEAWPHHSSSYGTLAVASALVRSSVSSP